MSEKNRKKQNYLFLLIGLSFGILIGTILMQNFGGSFLEPEIIYQNVTVEVEVEKQQPMLLLYNMEWFSNAEDSSETIFDYYIFNFGNVEAKDVKVGCSIQDEFENVIREEIFSIGNVASNSYEFQESIMKYNSVYLDEYSICEIKEVEGEYLNLLDRLSDL